MTPMLIYLGIVYCALCLGLYFFQRWLIFFPPGVNPLLHQHWQHCEFFIRHGYTTLQAWHIINENCNNHYSMIYFGGNAEEVAQNLDSARRYRIRNVFFINPSGYGKSTGTPSQAAFYADGLAVYDYITEHFHLDAKQVILTGRSLGAAVAIYINSQRPARALVVITPFDAIYNLIPGLLRWLFPIRLILKNAFDNRVSMPLIKNPILILAASDDEVIPQARTRNLLNYSHANTVFAVIPNTNHQTIGASERTFTTLHEFILQTNS